jgi:hypothetical protein
VVEKFPTGQSRDGFIASFHDVLCFPLWSFLILGNATESDFWGQFYTPKGCRSMITGPLFRIEVSHRDWNIVELHSWRRSGIWTPLSAGISCEMMFRKASANTICFWLRKIRPIRPTIPQLSIPWEILTGVRKESESTDSNHSSDEGEDYLLRAGRPRRWKDDTSGCASSLISNAD